MQYIPKKIHYCWFGNNEKSELVNKCISSWKDKLPDYEIIEWNEKNFDFNCNDYIREAYENKKWAFVSDFVRLYVLYEYGGIYLDTDVEVIKSFDSLLENKSFIGFESLDENITGVLTATIGSEKNNKIIKMLLDSYKNRKFIVNGKMDLTTNVQTITKKLQKTYSIKLENHEQYIEDNLMTIYPSDYFCPKNAVTQLKLTENTYSIHHFDGSWVSKKEKIRIEVIYRIKKFLKKFRIIQ
ncbi:Mannosyltransferase OCH1 and related enzymes [uncultured Clostridium sp.]|nr:Mannosyltransferase OCH1 and related enzymes [uncultured Clostridium sp.]SCJ15401.1 Mannosyltransferase OCH1 and related enzymes [uncultured Clostridium sp.]